jgi:hypothetical protein
VATQIGFADEKVGAAGPISVVDPPGSAFSSAGLSVYETEGHRFESCLAHRRKPADLGRLVLALRRRLSVWDLSLRTSATLWTLSVFR